MVFVQLKKSIPALLTVILAVGCCCANRPAAEHGYKNSGYSKKKLEAMGVNTEHLFVFTDVGAAYNGREFSIDRPVDSLVGIFGPDYRIHYGTEHNQGYDHYIWDGIGVTALVSPEKEVMTWSLHWDYLPKVKDYDYDDPAPALVPKRFFEGKMLLNGVPIDDSSDIAAYCNDKKVQRRLRELAREKGIRNYRECFYYYHLGSVNRYHNLHHKLYLFDYSAFEQKPFFAYRMKVTNESGRLHEFTMEYGIYTNPDAIKLF